MKVVLIIGGAVSGSTAVKKLTDEGIRCVVVEQNKMPYGKIEDGLPRWHEKQRINEYFKIDDIISHELVDFVPLTRIGKDVSFEEIYNMGWSCIYFANGAWKDRSFPIKEIEEFDNFYYQNPFVYWFNHYHESSYNGPNVNVKDDAIVIGGGLASIDVVKILMLETTKQALANRNIKTDILTLEHKGIPKTLENLGVEFEDLGVKGCTLFYRRRNMDMPLGPMPPNATPERIAKLQQVRVKILNNARRDYLFQFEERCKPIDKIVENDRLAGLIFRRTEIVDGRVKDIPNSEFEVRSPLTISSIGSIPEAIPGVSAKGELFIISDEDTGKFDDYENVFAVGNAVTGRGNIRESEVHARKVTQRFMDEFLNWSEDDFKLVFDQGWEKLAATTAKRTLATDQIQSILNRISESQQRVGYNGDYQKWVEKHLPVRLEDLLETEQN